MDRNLKSEKVAYYDKMELMERVEIWKKILSPGTKFVLFKNDTVVVLTGNEDITSEDVAEDAKEVMSNFGPVFVGSPAGDYRVIEPANVPGWIVAGHYPNMFVYVSPEEIQTVHHSNGLIIGHYGRGKRDKDGRNPEVIHVEN